MHSLTEPRYRCSLNQTAQQQDPHPNPLGLDPLSKHDVCPNGDQRGEPI